jgi:cytochrome c biogenesis protein CcmG, thiol:disulfide interchange protein DsbE
MRAPWKALGIVAGLNLVGLNLVGLCFVDSAYAAKAGEIAPAFSLPNVSGKTETLAALKGQVVLVDFWASWCGPCRESFPFLNRMQAQYAAKGLRVVGINVDEKQTDAARFLTKYPAQFAVLYDPAGSTPGKYDLKVMPSSYLIGRDGKIRFVHKGFRAKDQAAMEAAIQSALQEKS